MSLPSSTQNSRRWRRMFLMTAVPSRQCCSSSACSYRTNSTSPTRTARPSRPSAQQSLPPHRPATYSPMVSGVRLPRPLQAPSSRHCPTGGRHPSWPRRPPKCTLLISAASWPKRPRGTSTKARRACARRLTQGFWPTSARRLVRSLRGPSSDSMRNLKPTKALSLHCPHAQLCSSSSRARSTHRSASNWQRCSASLSPPSARSSRLSSRPLRSMRS
mmetsp:Transcript_7752/g.19118  ORF Transcript_7752/g.19118 Transcript_7752/m.19118 type:complete len:217 (+) Transcript_7752:469-1119(+)